MLRRLLPRFALLACLAAPLACAVGGEPGTYGEPGYETPPAPPAPDVARTGLHPAYRPFYDALEGEGDWTLIEPYGWVFRPRVNFDSWRPYQQGWWEASDVWGWIWYSTDTFGWVTDHYGSWFYDDFQGWVWQPGPVWGPGWVAWVSAGDYIGWAPLGPADYDGYSRVPSGVFTFTAAQNFGSMTTNSQALFVTRPPVSGRPVGEISNWARRGGVAFNRGPDATLLQRLGGIATPRAEEPEPRRVRLPEVAPPGEAELLLRTRRAVNAGLRDLGQTPVDAPAAPPSPKVFAPSTPPPTPPAPRSKDAPSDSLGARKDGPKPPGRSGGEARDPARRPGHPVASPDSTKR